MKAWQILDWDIRHENHDSRKIANGLSWCAMPDYEDMPIYNRLMRLPDPLAALGAYDAMVRLTRRLRREQRGWLLDRAGRPLTVQDMADITNTALEQWQGAIEHLVQAGWIGYAEMPCTVKPGEAAVGTLWQPPQEAPGDAGRLREVAGGSGRCREVAGDLPPTEQERILPDTTGESGPAPVIIPFAQHTGAGASVSRTASRNRAGLRALRPRPDQVAPMVRKYTDIANQGRKIQPVWAIDVVKVCASVGLSTAGQDGSLTATGQRLELHHDPPHAFAELLWKVGSVGVWAREHPGADPWRIIQAYEDEVIFAPPTAAAGA